MNEQISTNLDPINQIENTVTPENEIKNQTSSATYEYAVWYTRAAAYLIDGLITWAISLLAYLPFMLLISSNNPNVYTATSFIIGSVLSAGYFTWFISKDSATPGLKFLGLKIIKENGEKLSLGQSLLRYIIFMVISLINMILILFSSKKQGLHDMALGTICVKNDEKTSRAKWVLGLYCGCGCILPIIIFIIAVIIGAASVPSNLTNTSEITSNQSQVLPLNPVSEETVLETNSMVQEDQQETNSEFYKLCMQSNTNPTLDLSKYCVCAEKEFQKSTDVKAMVENCKDQVIIK